MGERVRGRANGCNFLNAVLRLRMGFGAIKGRIWRAAVVGIAASTAIGLTLGAIGPFGSYLNGTFFTRTAYWVVCIWGGMISFTNPGQTTELIPRRE